MARSTRNSSSKKPPSKSAWKERLSPISPKGQHRSRNRSLSLFVILVAVIVVLSGALATTGLPFLFAYLVVVSATAFATYGWDKFQAKRSSRRIPEACLHGLAIIGGTPGSYLGQRVFRHKTVKEEFRKRFWWILAIQVILLFFLASRGW